MRKLQENSSAKLRSIQGMMAETNLSRYMVMQVAQAANAVIRFSKHSIRIDVERFYAHLRKGVD